MVSRFRFRRVSAAVASIVALSACGSTVAARPGSGGAVDGGLAVAPGDAGAGQGAANEFGGGTAVGVPESAGFGESPGSGSSSSGFGGSGSGSTGSGGSSGSSGTSGASAGTNVGRSGTSSTSGAVGPGITATKIFFGAPYNSDAAAGNAALGADADSGDERDYWAAVLDDLNKRGGILGRKLEVIFHEFRAASNEPVEQQQQAACDKWTKDNKVFAVYGGGGEIMLECTRKAGVLATNGGSSTGPIYQRNPHLVDVSGIRFERLGQTSVDGLGRIGFFKPEPRWPSGKVGLISWDDPNFRYAYDKGYLPALKRQGIPLEETAWVAIPSDAGSIGEASAAISSAVLRFQSEGIDHVLIQDGPAGVFRGGALTLLFLQTAESQSYRPRYGFNANNFPGNPNFPPQQQSGMLATDYGDYQASQDDGIALNQHRERCFALMTTRGLSVADEQKRATAAGFCEFVWFLETILKRATVPTLAGAIRSAEGLGTSFGSPLTYGTRLAPGRHDGIELVRAARFDDACACMRYISKPYVP